MQLKQIFQTILFTSFALGDGVRRYNLTLTYAWDKQGMNAIFQYPLCSMIWDVTCHSDCLSDGHGRPTYLINNDTPGPVLVVNEGETLEAFVDNQLAIETTIHW